MRVLATARPNMRYRWHSSIRKVRLEARLKNNKVRYYEVFNGDVHCISESLTLSLFPTDCVIRDRPFLVRENQDFYTVLRRHTLKYKEQYKQLKRPK